MPLKVRVKQCSRNETLNNHPDLPRSIRLLIAGPSNCGKTQLVLNFLTNEGWVDYNKLMVYGRSLHQPEYVALKQAIDAKLSKDVIDRLFDNLVAIEKEVGVKLSDFLCALPSPRNGTTTAEYFEDDSNIPDPKDLDPKDHTFVLFDDISYESQTMVAKYYTRSRHNNVQCAYLAQDYFKVPRGSVRKNCSMICLFRQDGKSISHLWQDHACCDMTYEEFKKMCDHAWSKDYGFLTINLERRKENGKYSYDLEPIKF